MRRALRAAIGQALWAVVFMVPIAYLALPFLTVHELRTAVRAGDSAKIAGLVEWVSVRETLRTSLSVHMVRGLTAEGPVMEGEIADNGLPAPTVTQSVKRGLWQRFKEKVSAAKASVKASVGDRAVDKFVNSYITPEGLPRLLAYRDLYRQRISGRANGSKNSAAGPGGQDADALQDIISSKRKIRRAYFADLTTLTLEVASADAPHRKLISVFELKSGGWKLTQVFYRVESLLPRLSGRMT